MSTATQTTSVQKPLYMLTAIGLAFSERAMYCVWSGLNSAGLKRLLHVGRLDLHSRLEHDRHALDAELVRLIRVRPGRRRGQQPHRDALAPLVHVAGRSSRAMVIVPCRRLAASGSATFVVRTVPFSTITRVIASVPPDVVFSTRTTAPGSRTALGCGR